MFRNKTLNIVLILIIAVALLGIVGIVAYKTFLPAAGQEEVVPSAKELLDSQYEIGKMTTNLAGDALIQATIAIQSDSKAAMKEIEQRKAQIKDIINSTLHTTTQADIEKADGYQKLKVRLVEAMNKVMLEGKVTDVYISDIVVQ
ncbi:flagellar basal body-associated FliL family protein [Tumebacillus lipolyticus]|uniref:Flagellar protein FliL n=1 Tax=Tumebacillus lipolyticus TaxID=1280370 RepID=A0ABW5A1I8_9BACL